MMASLNHSSSSVSVACDLRSIGTSRSWRDPLRQTAKQQRGIARRIDAQPDAAPLDRMTLAGD